TRESGPDHPLSQPNQTGVLFADSRINLGHVCDGTAFTVMVGETLVNDRRIQADHSGVEQLVDHWAIASPTLRLNEFSEALGSTAVPLGIALQRDPNLYPDDQELSFSSHHPPGSLFVFCDGHVDLLGNQIDREVYRALGTRRAKEVIGEGAF
ncbi:MAG: DUF1559 domain-containing protein, partial [Pirellulales bacterium]|nr:DUF1559 domain-containing protein [Pirellulales bacterium]